MKRICLPFRKDSAPCSIWNICAIPYPSCVRLPTRNICAAPIPASGLCAASLAAFAAHYEQTANTFLANNFAIPAITLFLSFLMISEIPMFSLKFKSLKWKTNAQRYTFLCITIPAAAVLLVLKIHWTGIVFFIFAFYIIWNAAAALFRKLSDK